MLDVWQISEYASVAQYLFFLLEMHFLNPFHATGLFQYHLKTRGFLMFQGVLKEIVKAFKIVG